MQDLSHPSRPRENLPTPTLRDLHIWIAAYDCTMDLHEEAFVCPVGKNHLKARAVILRYLVKVATTERKQAQCTPHNPSAS